MATRRAVSSFSLLLALAASAATADYAKIAARLRSAPSTRAKADVLREAAGQEVLDEELSEDLGQLRQTEGRELEEVVQRLERHVLVRARFQKSEPDPNARNAASKVKANPLYRDPDPREAGNWAYRSLKRLEDLFKRRRSATTKMPSAPAISGLDRLIVGVVWVLLGAAILAFLVFAVRHFTWKKRLRRQTRALLEEDEPERTLDEWLGLADELAKAGRNREAVRCLYIACLLKFDEHGVARFDRGETNWEHLARIERSARTPAGLDFREPTQAFDRIWYGFKGGGPDDVARFRSWYLALSDKLRVAA